MAAAPFIVVSMTSRRMPGADVDVEWIHVKIFMRLADALIADTMQGEASVLRSDELEVLRKPRIEIGHVRCLAGLQANEWPAVHRVEPVFQIRKLLPTEAEGHGC